jgi:acyl carrier protein
MTPTALIESILRRDVGDLDPATPLKGIAGWDSLMMVRLMLRLEEVAGRELAEDELAGIATLADLEPFLGKA